MSPFPLTIRQAADGDSGQVAHIAAASALSSIDDLPGFRDAPDAVAQAMSRFAIAGIDRTLVAERNESLVGYVSTARSSGEITDLFVSPSHQNQGVGAVLLAAAEAVLKGAGHRRTWLTTHAANQAALRFYRTHGYALLSISDASGETMPHIVYPQAMLMKQLSRPNAAAATTMAQVREGIDTLDPMLMSLVIERFAFIDRASELKPALAMPARVSKRVEEVVTNAKRLALDTGFDPNLTETLWRTMIDLAIEREQSAMAVPNKLVAEKPVADETAA